MSELRELMEIAQCGNFVLLDTETTGLDQQAEIVQIAVVDSQGRTLMDTLIKPTCPIPSGATSVHHITNDTVKDAPSWMDVRADLIKIAREKHLIIYNAAYDTKLLFQSDRAHDDPAFPARRMPDSAKAWTQHTLEAKSIVCAMLAYGEYTGDWNDRYGNYTWTKLGVACDQQGIQVVDAHNARGDCLMTLALIRAMQKGYHDWVVRRDAMRQVIQGVHRELSELRGIVQDGQIDDLVNGAIWNLYKAMGVLKG